MLKRCKDAHETASKRVLVIQLVIKSLTKLQKHQKLHSKIIQIQLQMSMINEIPKERYISPEETQKIIDDLRLI